MTKSSFKKKKKPTIKRSYDNQPTKSVFHQNNRKPIELKGKALMAIALKKVDVKDFCFRCGGKGQWHINV